MKQMSVAPAFKLLFALAILFGQIGCAYRFGAPERTLPGGYSKVKIPIFKNLTQETGIEVFFTRSLKNQFERSQVAVVEDEDSEVFIDGHIDSVQYKPQGKRTKEDISTLADGAVLAAEYRVLIVATVSVLKKSDLSVLWTGQFKGERTYSAPQITTAIVNSADPLYNQSARRRTIENISQDMMAEAHDRMTENF
jgi:hypothetical protein